MKLEYLAIEHLGLSELALTMMSQSLCEDISCEHGFLPGLRKDVKMRNVDPV